jgi:hypothetical protein
MCAGWLLRRPIILLVIFASSFDAATLGVDGDGGSANS